MADVVLCYSEEDRNFINQIAQNLTRLGLEVWYDIQLDSGEHRDEGINNQLKIAKSVLICWSPNSIKCRLARAQALHAYNMNKLAAAFVARCELTPPFNNVHAPDLSDWAGGPEHSGWLIVARSLGKICGRPGIGKLAETLAMNSTDALVEWSKAFPDEPLAQKTWASREPPLRERFLVDQRRARAELDSAVKKLRNDGEAALAQCAETFERWLQAERSGTGGMRPDPVTRLRAGLEQNLLNESLENTLRDLEYALVESQQALASRNREFDRIVDELAAAQAALAAATETGTTSTSSEQIIDPAQQEDERKEDFLPKTIVSNSLEKIDVLQQKDIKRENVFFNTIESNPLLYLSLRSLAPFFKKFDTLFYLSIGTTSVFNLFYQNITLLIILLNILTIYIIYVYFCISKKDSSDNHEDPWKH